MPRGRTRQVIGSALLDWIDAQPDLDGSRVAAMGASSGGYVALAALARYAERLRCGVDMFGIADLPAFLAEARLRIGNDLEAGYGGFSECTRRDGS